MKAEYICFERIIGQLRLWCKIILEICMQTQKFLQDIKTLSFSCLASVYLLCSSQAKFSFFEGFLTFCLTN